MDQKPSFSAWFKKVSGTVVRSTFRAVPATVPDTFLHHAAFPTRKWLLRAVYVAILAAMIWGVHRTLLDAWQQFEHHRQAGRVAVGFSAWWLVLSGALYLLALLPAGLFWHRALVVLGQDARVGETLRAYYIGHLGKYVPGKAWVVLIRAGLLRSRRVDMGVAAAAVFLETLTMMAVGAALAAAYLAVTLRGDPLLFWAALAMIPLAGLPTLPPVFSRAARWLGVAKGNPAAAEKLRTLGFRTLLEGWAAMLVSWPIAGLSLWATLRGLGIEGLDPLGELPRYTATAALATVAGFVILAAPGGLGVREFVLIALLVPYLESVGPQAEGALPASLAACLGAALLRIVWLVAEVGISGILYPWGMRRSDAGAKSQEGEAAR